MKAGKTFGLPVIHYSQLLGLALGFTPEEVGLHLNEMINLKFDEKIAQLQRKIVSGK